MLNKHWEAAQKRARHPEQGVLSQSTTRRATIAKTSRIKRQ